MLAGKGAHGVCVDKAGHEPLAIGGRDEEEGRVVDVPAVLGDECGKQVGVWNVIDEPLDEAVGGDGEERPGEGLEGRRGQRVDERAIVEL